MHKNQKNNGKVFRSGKKGFTFVEMVIVGVIIAIISAVAIPIYTSTIANKRKAMVDELAQTAAVSANSFVRRTGKEDEITVPDLNLFLPQADKFEVTIDKDNREITVKDITAGISSDPASY